MALAFMQRQKNYWVDDLTEDEAEEVLKIYGQQDKTKEFLVASSLAAFFCFVLS